MTEPVKIDAAELAKMIATAVAAALPAKKAKGEKKGRKLLTDGEKAEKRSKVDALTVTAFEKLGYKNVKPRENVRTFNKWIENGRRVKKGEKSVKCGSWPLFHLDQTEPVKAEGTVH